MFAKSQRDSRSSPRLLKSCETEPKSPVTSPVPRSPPQDLFPVRRRSSSVLLSQKLKMFAADSVLSIIGRIAGFLSFPFPRVYLENFPAPHMLHSGCSFGENGSPRILNGYYRVRGISGSRTFLTADRGVYAAVSPKTH